MNNAHADTQMHTQLVLLIEVQITEFNAKLSFPDGFTKHFILPLRVLLSLNIFFLEILFT